MQFKFVFDNYKNSEVFLKVLFSMCKLTLNNISLPIFVFDCVDFDCSLANAALEAYK